MFALLQRRDADKSASLDPDDPESSHYSPARRKEPEADENSESRIAEFENQRNCGACLCILYSAFCILVAGCSPAAVAQPQAAPPAGGALEVVLAGKPMRKTLTLTTTQPARIEAMEQTPIHSKLAAYVGEVLVDYRRQA